MSIFSKLFWVSLLLFVGTSANAAVDHRVTVGGGANVFSPRALTINAGDTVTFVSGGGFHNVVADDNSFTSGGPTDTFSFTHAFPTAGTFRYYCSVHGGPGGAGMSGTITVNDVVTPPPAGPPITAATSGSWYDPDQSGHGFLVQVAPPNIFIAYWFVYSPDGTQQAWLAGAGNYDTTSNTATIEMQQEVGAKFPPNFVHGDLVSTDWGSLTFTFTDCTHATVSWISKVPAYGSGSLPISKLIGINGLTCTN